MQVLVKLSNGTYVFGKQFEVDFIPTKFSFSDNPPIVGVVEETEIDFMLNTNEVFCVTQATDYQLTQFAKENEWFSLN